MIKSNNTTSAFLLLLLCFFSKELFAFDPLFTESNLPLKHYDFYNDKEQIFDKSCNAIDFSKEKITILYAINLALCNNPNTKISWLNTKKQAAIYGITKSSYLPTISGSYSKGNEASWSNSDSSVSNQKVTNKSVTLDWLLYDFGKRSANKERDYFALVQSAQQHNRNLQNIIYQVVSAYSNLFAANETLRAAKLSEESNKLAYDVILKKFQIGTAPRVDVYRIEANYAQATLLRQQAENSVANYLGAFLQVLNLPQGTQVTLEEPYLIRNASFLTKEIKSLVEEALKNRPDLQALIAQDKSLRADNLASNLNRLPKISLYGSKDYSYNKNDTAQQSDSIGVKLSFDFFTGFNKTYAIKETDYSHQSIKEQKRALENQIAYDVWSAGNNLMTAKETEITAQKLLKSALETKKATLEMYKVGRSSSVDVVTAESSYANALKSLVSAKYGKFTSEASLLLALGSLNQALIAEQPLHNTQNENTEIVNEARLEAKAK